MNSQITFFSIILDLIFCIAIFFVVGFLSIVLSIAVTGSREDGLGASIYAAIPLITITFFLIRRRHKLLISTLQAIITIGLLYLWIVLIRKYPDAIPEKHSALIFLSSIPILMTIIKFICEIVTNMVNPSANRSYSR